MLDPIFSDKPWRLAFQRSLILLVGGVLAISPTAISSTRAEPTGPHPETSVSQDSLTKLEKKKFEQQEKAVIHAVLQLQEQLGGSIVQKRESLQPLEAMEPPQLTHHPPETNPPTTIRLGPDFTRITRPYQARHTISTERVILLRETASELDRTANRLEWARLYSQADRVRELAQELRLEARNPPSPKTPAYEVR